MDKKIKKIARDEQKVVKETKGLLKADKKRDVKMEKCDKIMGKKMNSHVKSKKH